MSEILCLSNYIPFISCGTPIRDSVRQRHHCEGVVDVYRQGAYTRFTILSYEIMFKTALPYY